MSLNYPSFLKALGSIVGATGVAVWTAGGVTPARTAAGTYTLTLGEGVDSTQCAVLVTPRGATPSIVSVAQTSDTVKTVHVADALGAAADIDFDFAIFQAPLS